MSPMGIDWVVGVVGLKGHSNESETESEREKWAKLGGPRWVQRAYWSKNLTQPGGWGARSIEAR